MPSDRNGELSYARFTVRAVAISQIAGGAVAILLLWPIFYLWKPGPVVGVIAYLVACVAAYYLSRQVLRVLFVRSRHVQRETRATEGSSAVES